MTWPTEVSQVGLDLDGRLGICCFVNGLLIATIICIEYKYDVHPILTYIRIYFYVLHKSSD